VAGSSMTCPSHPSHAITPLSFKVATLGIVEFFLHLLAEYYPDYDKDRKQVFADVHFLLFYTAILNALQTVLTAFATKRRSKRLWVQTEMLELNHYVEIREEFQRVKQELDRLNNRISIISTSKSTRETSGGTTREASGYSESDTTKDVEELAVLPSNGVSAPTTDDDKNKRGHGWMRSSNSEGGAEFDRITFGVLWKALMDQIRYPNLRRKYNKLLMQIRFHELRVHFLEAYDLPKKLKISDYLIRSEQALLVKMVNVSTVAWLLLTGAVCFLYYVLGMVFYKFGTEKLVGSALIWIFFCSVASFVLISWLVSNKMNSIFRAIMHKKTLWDVRDAETEAKDRLAAQQLALFWGGEPKYVITALKFMQFGYAVALSTLIIFFEEIKDGNVRMEWYMIMIFCCYALFLQVTSHAIPSFVLCTSLGQLVDERRLREVVALFRLDEAKQKQLELLEIQNYEKDVLVQDSLDRMNAKPTEPAVPIVPAANVASTNLPASAETILPQLAGPDPLRLPQPLPEVAEPIVDELRYAQPPPIPTVHEGAQATFESATPPNDMQDPFANLQAPRLGRRNYRRKVVSDGVSVMASLQEDPLASESLVDGTFDHLGIAAQDDSLLSSKPPHNLSFLGEQAENKAADLAARRQERRSRRKKSASDGVALMAQLREAETGTEFSGNRIEKPFNLQRLALPLKPSSALAKHTREKQKKVDEGDLLAELVKLDTESLRETLKVSDRTQQRQGEEMKTTARSRRRKVVSDGVGAMAAMGSNMSSAAGRVLGLQQSPTSQTARDDFDFTWRAPSMEQPQSREGLEVGVGVDEAATSRQDRRARRKAVSDSVAAMASLGSGRLQDFLGSTEDWQRESATKSSRTLADTGALVRSKSERPSRGVDVPSHDSSVSAVPVDAVDAVDATKEEADDSSIHSASSTVGYSDVDDVPATAPSLSTRHIQDHLPRPSFRLRLRSYFLSSRYIVVSNVFGTIVAFYLVGQRVEGFIHSEAIISEEFVSLYVPLTSVFWLLTSWFCLFLSGSGLIFYSVGHCHVGIAGRTRKEKEIIVAMGLDVILTTVCLIVLFVAEAERCCHPISDDPESRVLADETVDKYGEENSSREPPACSCPAFGSRLYGGLGTIEPYTSLVLLRILRHWVARAYVRRTNHGAPGLARSDSSRHDDSMRPIVSELDLLESHHGMSHPGHAHSGKDHGTVVAEVWESTIGKYPDLVAQHGEFSGEVLRAMLGVALLKQAQPAENGAPSSALVATDAAPARSLPSSKSFSLNEEYAGLSPAAQEIILAGKLGCSLIKSASQKNLQTLEEEPETNHDEETEHPESHEPISMVDRNILFEVDTRGQAPNDYFMEFDSPNARLVRSMRRCDRKLLPMLEKWSVVDCVMTRFEMVYFDAVGADECGLCPENEGTRQALVATRGGKGLRLCDVAVGRRIVGRLSFSEVASVHVERIMPSEGSMMMGDSPDVEVEKTEFWQSASHNLRASYLGDGLKRGVEWSTIKQDRLRLHTQHGGTLYLRFYADLERGKHHADLLAAEDEVDGVLNKNNAFQWAQTIGRFCGPDQLKQPLSHFGDDSTEELRDYLVVVAGSEEGKTHRRNKSSDLLFRVASRKKLLHHRRASLSALELPTESSTNGRTKDGPLLAAGSPVNVPGLDLMQQPTDSSRSPVRRSRKNLSRKVSFEGDGIGIGSSPTTAEHLG